MRSHSLLTLTPRPGDGCRAGRTPRDTTHHPLRQSNLFAYQALKHRHEPEIREFSIDPNGIVLGDIAPFGKKETPGTPAVIGGPKL